MNKRIGDLPEWEKRRRKNRRRIEAVSLAIRKTIPQPKSRCPNKEFVKFQGGIPPLNLLQRKKPPQNAPKGGWNNSYDPNFKDALPAPSERFPDTYDHFV
jgi:hypothetical protein